MNEIKRTLQFIFLKELPKLSDICYYPAMNQYLPRLRQVVDEKSITFQKDFKMLKNEFTAILLYIIQTNNDMDVLLLAYKVLTLQIYGILMRKFIKYCDKTRLSIALDKLHGRHLFKQMGIEKALLYTAERVFKRYEKANTEEEVIKMFLELRTAIAQLVRALARRYYAITNTDIEQYTNQLNKQLAAIIIKEVKYNSYPECLDYAIENLDVNAQDVVHAIQLIQQDVIYFQDFLTLLLTGVTKKTQLCSPIWRKSRLSLITQKTKLYDYLHSKFKAPHMALYLAIVRYYLCVIKHMFC